MRAVMLQVPEDLLAWRRKIGADQWDEMWEGVLHMVPSPTREHQDLEGALETWLRRWWVPAAGGRVYHQINVARAHPGKPWIYDYRVPDLVLLTPARAAIDRNEYFAGGPDAVVEIRSPGDESLDKIPFYAAVGVRELWLIDRSTRIPELWRLDGPAPERVAPRTDGWLPSLLGVELRAAAPAQVALRLQAQPASDERLP